MLITRTQGLVFRDDRYGTLVEKVSSTSTPLRRVGFAHVLVDARKRSPDHCHTRTEELYLVVAGSGSMFMDGLRNSIKSGDTVLIPPGVVHSVEADDFPLEFVCVTAPPYDPEDDIEVSDDFRTATSGSGRILGPEKGEVWLDDNFGRVVSFGSGVLRKFLFFLASARYGQNTPRHFHKLTEEMFFMLRGGAEIFADGVSFDLIPGDAVTVPPGIVHSLTPGLDGVHYVCLHASDNPADDDFFTP